VTAVGEKPSWKEALEPHSQSSTKRALFDVATSLLPYMALFAINYLTLGVSPILTIALVIPIGLFLIRTFVVFHDCAHGSLFPSRGANNTFGIALGLIVLTPFRAWRHEHAVHHATSGDLDRRGVGDVDTWTISEYYSKSWPARVGYRLFRNPLVMFGVGPIFAMIIGPRIVMKGMRPRIRNSVLITDVLLVPLVALLVWLMGWSDFLIVWLPGAMLAGSLGIWLFYVQHQFEDAYWQRGDDWNYVDAALRGSTYLKLPKVLQFFSANIGLHHVHHLNARIPNYNLQRAHESDPIFATVPTISLLEGCRTVRLKLVDERGGKLVTFAQARRIAHAASPADALLSTAALSSAKGSDAPA
jgi:omega-6 fatty acid desaturase (delta-12 desaturase)